MAAVMGYAEPLKILCTREFQNSVKDSFHAEVKGAIQSTPWLADAYDVGIDYIRGKNGTEFIFRGLRNNIKSIKSMAQIDICIVEEADDTPEQSWINLEPTIRAAKSEIWVIWNPSTDNSPTDRRFKKRTPPRSMIVEMNWQDNPAFPKVLNEQRLDNLKTMDDSTYAHIWDGKYMERSKAQIFRDKYRVEEFTPAHDWDGPYQGLDFGFSQDPTAGVKCWVFNRCLYIEHEAGQVGLELDDTSEFINGEITGFENHTIRADCARPESISYLKRKGMPLIVGVEKGKGSVEDGIEHIKSYSKVIIHERCKAVTEEFRLYSYKVDRLSGDVLNIIIDANNHYIDAIRYALQPVMKNAMTDYGAIL
jgi:phage terminase large subunit